MHGHRLKRADLWRSPPLFGRPPGANVMIFEIENYNTKIKLAFFTVSLWKKWLIILVFKEKKPIFVRIFYYNLNGFCPKSSFQFDQFGRKFWPKFSAETDS
jgi:hypothetical protein